MKKTTVYDCSMVEMDKHHHETGNITVIENGKTIPFDVKRVYYLYDIPGGESRGAHAHKELKQLIIAASGSFEVTLDDGNVKRTFTLNRPYQGLLVVPGIWRELNNFSSGAVCLVMASLPYDEKDYIREYDHFINYKKYDNADKYKIGNFSYSASGIERVEIDWVAGEVNTAITESDILNVYENGENLAESEQLHYYSDGKTLFIKYCKSLFSGEIAPEQKSLNRQI